MKVLGSALAVMFKVDHCCSRGLSGIKHVMLASILQVYLHSTDNSYSLLALILDTDAFISIQARPQSIEWLPAYP